MRLNIRSNKTVAITLILFSICFGLGVVEGIARIFAPAAISPIILAERRHTEYDPELGWINRPNMNIPDMYGPGVGLRTNQQRFRGARDVTEMPTEGVKRIVCTGDSFTIGYGVSDNDAWCNALERFLPGIEAINMGQGGYGLDQAYLWYRRDGARFAHHVLVFAFISNDFTRMLTDAFLGYPKPRLRIIGECLQLERFPVPLKQELPLKWSAAVQLARMSLAKIKKPASPDEYLLLAKAVIDRVRTLAALRGAELLLVHIPTQGDKNARPIDASRIALREFAQSHGIAHLDLVEISRKLPPEVVNSMYFTTDIAGLPYSRGHMTIAGNEFVAREVLKAIHALPYNSSPRPLVRASQTFGCL
jgi:lysophospholipase L1-like esterase